MSKAKAPARQFYRGDWKRDASVQSCSYAARGLWFEMLLLMEDCDPFGHLVMAGKPLTASQIARMTGGETPEVETLLLELKIAKVYSVDADGAIFNRRMERERQQKVNKKNAGKLSAISRLRDTRPTDVEQKQNAPADAVVVEAVSFGFEKEAAIPQSLDLPEFRQALAEWLDYRAERNLEPWTLRTIVAKLGQFEEMGLTRAVIAIRHSIAEGWKGIFEPRQDTRPAAPKMPNFRTTPEISDHEFFRVSMLAMLEDSSLPDDEKTSARAALQNTTATPEAIKAALADHGLRYDGDRLERIRRTA